MVDHEPSEGEENSWVLVKKQKITILIPPPSPRSLLNGSLEPTTDNHSHPIRKSKQPFRELKADHMSHRHIGCLMPFFGARNPNFLGSFGNGNALHQAERKLPLSRKHRSKSGIHAGALNLVNIRVRAQNLEKQLQRLGGLRRWLASQGLSQFTGTLEREKMGMHHLANLTMIKLKSIGINAVGPRRKLIHAIDRLCQPYYKEAVRC